MNNNLSNIGVENIVKSALEGPYGPLALAIGGILAALAMYMSYTTGVNCDVQDVEKEVAQ